MQSILRIKQRRSISLRVVIKRLAPIDVTRHARCFAALCMTGLKSLFQNKCTDYHAAQVLLLNPFFLLNAPAGKLINQKVSGTGQTHRGRTARLRTAAHYFRLIIKPTLFSLVAGCHTLCAPYRTYRAIPAPRRSRIL